MSYTKYVIDDYILLKCLGRGTFGEVFLTTKEGQSEVYATKKMDREYADNPKVSKYLQNEIDILKELNHKNIVRLIDVKITQSHYYLIMEFCNGGSLSDCLKKYQEKLNKPFTEEIVQHLMRQIIDGIKYIHNRNIVHRDLKLDNILVNFKSEIDKKDLNMMKAQVKIIDFGFATHITKNDLCHSTLGSPINMDPIILKKLAEQQMGIDDGKNIAYDQKADIWSLGTLCYEMLIGKSAFDAESMQELVEKIESGSYNLPSNFSKEVISFLNGMLQYKPQKRLNANDLARHHFLTHNINDFESIDVRKVSNKIKNNNLNVNIKRNNTIWSIFNEEEENKLIKIPGNYLEDSPIKEEDEEEYKQPLENKRRNTEKIPHLQKENNYQNYPQSNNNPHEFIKKNTQYYPPQSNYGSQEFVNRNPPNYNGYSGGYGGMNPYQNTINNNGYGYGFSNYPPQPHMQPYPYPMPMIIPASIPPQPEQNEYNSNSESGFSFSSGVFDNSNNDKQYSSGTGGYGYGYGYGYGN